MNSTRQIALDGAFASKLESAVGTGKKIMRKIGSKRNALAIAIVLALAGMPEAAWAKTLRLQSSFADTGISDIETTCDPVTFLPKTGEASCVGIQTTSGTESGAIAAGYLADVSWAVFESGDSVYTAYTTFTGTIAGHGSGSFTILESSGFISSLGKLTARWQVLKGSATGDFAGMTGSGKIQGTYDSTTGLATGTKSGVLHFTD